MVDRTDQQIADDVSKKLKKILDDVLATGDWDSSLFLKTAATKLRNLSGKIKSLYDNPEIAGKSIDTSKGSNHVISPSGYTQVFILLYQVDGANLQGWSHTIKTLVEHGGSRPTYKDENNAQEFMRSKASNIERNGYVIATIKDDAFYQVAQHVDAFGNQLFALKENAIKLENITEFVHANKNRYAVQNGELILLGKI